MLAEIFGCDSFFLELQHKPNIKEQLTVNEAMVSLARELGLPLVATHDVHYLSPDDAEAQDVLVAIQTNRKVAEEDRLSMKHEDFSLASGETMEQYFAHLPEAIANSGAIARRVNLEIPLGKNVLPSFTVPAGETSDSYLRTLTLAGVAKRYPKTSEDEAKTIRERIDYELSVIAKTGFASYFLIVQDFVNWAKTQKISVGPGRGSAAGSIVSYLLNITDVDPLAYGLLFERFLNPARISMPDIDLDFADDRRDEVIRYVAQKYGHDHVAQIITFGTMAARAAIRDAGRAMSLPYSFCDQLAKMIPFGMSLTEALEKNPELKERHANDADATRVITMARKLEGVARNASTHACGVVITKEPLTEYVPLQHSSQDDETIITQYEMHAVESLGLLKMDFLGLRNLTVIQNTLATIQTRHGVAIDIATLPLDDEKTFALLRAGNTTGIFQLESAGMRRYLKQLAPTTLEDIIAMISLYRPGPMEAIPDFVNAKHGRRQVTYLHPVFEPILKNTYGVIVYQDQVLEIARRFAGFTYAEADILRKAVGKKIKSLLDEQKKKFIDGAVREGHREPLAKKVWDFIEPFARYGFNKAHAACYAMIAYETAYLKANYPAEFMASLMTGDVVDSDRITIEVDECRNLAIRVLPPAVNESREQFTVVDNATIRFGLSAIKNVGSDLVDAVVRERTAQGPFRSLSDFLARVRTKALNRKSLESLAKCGALDELGERRSILHDIERILIYARRVQKDSVVGQAGLFAATAEAETLTLTKVSPATGNERLRWEKELIGFYISDHPVRAHAERLRLTTIPIHQLDSEAHEGRRVTVGGVITTITRKITREGNPMLFVALEDVSGKLEAVIFPSVLTRTAALWREDEVVVAAGRITFRDGTSKLLVSDAKEVTENRELLMYEVRNGNGFFNHAQSSELKAQGTAFASQPPSTPTSKKAPLLPPSSETVDTNEYVVTIPATCGQAIFSALKTLFERHKGTTPVLLEIERAREAPERIRTTARITVSEDLSTEIERLTGTGTAVVRGRTSMATHT